MTAADHAPSTKPLRLVKVGQNFDYVPNAQHPAQVVLINNQPLGGSSQRSVVHLEAYDASCAVHIFTVGILCDVMDVLMVITAEGVPFVNSAAESFGVNVPGSGAQQCADWIEDRIEKWLGMPPTIDTFRPEYLTEAAPV